MLPPPPRPLPKIRIYNGSSWGCREPYTAYSSRSSDVKLLKGVFLRWPEGRGRILGERAYRTGARKRAEFEKLLSNYGNARACTLPWTLTNDVDDTRRVLLRSRVREPRLYYLTGRKETARKRKWMRRKKGEHPGALFENVKSTTSTEKWMTPVAPLRCTTNSSIRHLV